MVGCARSEEGGRRFLVALERVLQHGLHSPVLEQPGRGGLWPAMEGALQRSWAREIRDLASVHTNEGRVRALLRAALNGKFLDHLLRSMLRLAP